MSILLKPHITEKATGQHEEGIYAFVVARDANKLQIKTAVEEMYGVSVDSVRTLNFGGKPKYRYTKSGIYSGRSNHYKKAVVYLAEGEFIDFFDSEGEFEDVE